MTGGDPIRLMLGFAVPLFIGNIFQQVYSVADIAITGHWLGQNAISAIGATTALYSLMINFASGMNSGCAIVLSHGYGAGSEDNVRKSVAGMILIDIVISAIVTALSLLFPHDLISAMNTPDNISSDARTYIVIILSGITATNAYNMLAAILRAVGDTRTPLKCLMFCSILNIALDWAFVVLFGFGVAGAAAATVISQGISVVLCGVYILRRYRGIVPGASDFRLSRTEMFHLISYGLASGFMLCVVDFGSVIFQRANNALGGLAIAAYTAARRITVIMMQPLGTISTALSVFVAQNWGAGQADRAVSGVRKAFLLEYIWCGISFSVIFVFGRLLASAATGIDDHETLDMAVFSMRANQVLFPTLGPLLCLRSSMIAVGRRFVPVASSCIELAMKALSAAFVIPIYGFTASSLTEPLTWVVMLIFLAWDFRRRGLR